MPAPKNPSTAAATAAVRRKGQEAKAAALHAEGWFLVAPERAEEVRLLISTSSSYTEDRGNAEWQPSGREGRNRS